jgi:hypothetical protein
MQLLGNTIDERRFTRKKGAKSLEFRGDFDVGIRGRGRVHRAGDNITRTRNTASHCRRGTGSGRPG